MLSISDVRAGEVHALVGENGAGKSTLIKILAGVHAADAGEIRLRGRLVDPTAEALPIAFIHQDLGLVDTMTVAENIAIITGYPRRGGLICWREARAAALAVLRRMGGGVDPDARVGDLAAAEKSIVAIARSMAVQCDHLVLDEPTAALPETDVALLLEALRRLRACGVGIVYVTHRLDEVFRFADHVTVLRDGHSVATDAVPETDRALLVYNIVGHALTDLFIKPDGQLQRHRSRSRRPNGGGCGAFVIQGGGRGNHRARRAARRAGHDIVGRAIFGDTPITAGRIAFDGRTIDAAMPKDMIRRRVGFVSSKRGEESLAPKA